MNKTKLTWDDVPKYYDSSGYRPHPFKDTPFAEYIAMNGYRKPSRAWPNSYINPLLTYKFAKWLVANDLETANELGLNLGDQK
tara:strand:- start:1458 stop:1706 length:249 start_codon:yes stop_codon:yes gene_type:complete